MPLEWPIELQTSSNLPMTLSLSADPIRDRVGYSSATVRGGEEAVEPCQDFNPEAKQTKSVAVRDR